MAGKTYGVENFLAFVDEHCPGAFVPIDLLRVTKAVGVQQNSKLSIVIDGEACLDRLYGGYVNDWSCGGQWNRMVDFVQVLVSTLQQANIAAVVFFNAAIEDHKQKEWIVREAEKCNRVRQILRHVHVKCTPPPKVIWIPPVCLRSALRMVLRHCNVPAMQTVEDHKQEIMAFVHANSFDVICADSAEYAFFQSEARLLSASAMKLTYRGTLETRELIVEEATKQLNLHESRLCLLAAMLGGHIVTVEHLRPFYNDLLLDSAMENKTDSKVIIPAVVAFLRNVESISDLKAIGLFVFRTEKNEQLREEKARRFVLAVEYYMNGSKEHSQKFSNAGDHFSARMKECIAASKRLQAVFSTSMPGDGDEAALDESNEGMTAGEVLASEDVEEGGVVVEATQKVEAVVDPEALKNRIQELELDDSADQTPQSPLDLEEPPANATSDEQEQASPNAADDQSLVNEYAQQPKTKEEQPSDTAVVSAPERASSPTQSDRPLLPAVHPQVLQTAYTRHQRGLMHPWILQVLLHGQIKLERAIEDYFNAELPPGWLVFRPVRQAVYAILFNINHNNFLMKIQKGDTAAPQAKKTTPQQKRKQKQQQNKGGGSPKEAATEVAVEKAAGDAETSKATEKSKVEISTVPDSTAKHSRKSNEHDKDKVQQAHPAPTDIPTRVVIKEWIYKPRQQQPVNQPHAVEPDIISAQPVEWKGVPTVRRLWCGKNADNKRKRLKTFLNVLHADTPLMLSTAHVQQNLLLLCCVLRYLVQQEHRVLNRHELDAFLAQAVSLQLQNAARPKDDSSISTLQYQQKTMPINCLTLRGVQLAQLFMQGVEHALFANDACGAPIPWVMCCPWQFFDGRLFQTKLDIVSRTKSLLELCAGDLDQVGRVDRARSAVLQGIEALYMVPPAPPMLGFVPIMTPRAPHLLRGTGAAPPMRPATGAPGPTFGAVPTDRRGRGGGTGAPTQRDHHMEWKYQDKGKVMPGHAVGKHVNSYPHGRGQQGISGHHMQRPNATEPVRLPTTNLAAAYASQPATASATSHQGFPLMAPMSHHGHADHLYGATMPVSTVAADYPMLSRASYQQQQQQTTQHQAQHLAGLLPHGGMNAQNEMHHHTMAGMNSRRGGMVPRM